MLKIRIEEIFRHRNETTFRPWIEARNLFRDIGIQFVFEDRDADLHWLGQASYLFRQFPYENSISSAIKRVNKFMKGKDFVMFDGQDSASLMGTYDVFKEVNPLLLLKNTLYKDKKIYKEKSNFGRIYWENDSKGDFAIQDDLPWDKIKLSGANWLSTMKPHWYDFTKIEKDIDICALFSYPCKQNWEWSIETNEFYDKHRKPLIDQLNGLKTKYKIAMLEDGKHVPIQEYYNLMSRSKIVIAPFGYGEIAPRDIEASMVGSILLKPKMDHIETVPNVYNQTTFVDCEWDYSNVPQKIEWILAHFKQLQEYYVSNMRREYEQKYNPEKLVRFTYDWISTLPGYGSE